MELIETSKIQLIEGYRRVYSINDYMLPDDKDTYNKYLPLSYLQKDLNDKVTFVSPIRWMDSYERRFFDLGYTSLSHPFSAPDVYCMCLTAKQAKNEDAMWRMYTKPGEVMVNVFYKINNLLNQLDSAAIRDHFKVFIGKVKYLDKKSIIKIRPSAITGFGLADYLNLLTIKRIAFDYENEVRLFVVKDRGSFKGTTDCTTAVHIRNLKKCIAKVRVSPFPPSSTSFPLPLSQDLLDQEKKIVAKQLSGIKVDSSLLYETTPKCKL